MGWRHGRQQLMNKVLEINAVRSCQMLSKCCAFCPPSKCTDWWQRGWHWPKELLWLVLVKQICKTFLFSFFQTIISRLSQFPQPPLASHAFLSTSYLTCPWSPLRVSGSLQHGHGDKWTKTEQVKNHILAVLCSSFNSPKFKKNEFYWGIICI